MGSSIPTSKLYIDCLLMLRKGALYHAKKQGLSSPEKIEKAC